MAELSIRVLILDSSEQVRVDLRALLEPERCIHLVGEAGSLSTGLAAALLHKPDLVLVGIKLPDASGFEACQAIRAKAPGIRFLLLSSMADAALADEAYRCGAQGCLPREINGSGLLKAIREAVAGERIFDPAITARAAELVRNGALSKLGKT